MADGVTLSSRVLRANLADVHRAFPFVVTCGTELADWAESIEGTLEAFWADAIMEEALDAALDAVTEHMVRRYDLGQTSMMNPGSYGLADRAAGQPVPHPGGCECSDRHETHGALPHGPDQEHLGAPFPLGGPIRELPTVSA